MDMVVKLGLGVLVGCFALIWGGMFLTRPDRSIPPYSVGAQEETVVAIHVPDDTSDEDIEKLIERFRIVGHEGRKFEPMKINPTTPDHPGDHYRRMTIYIFSDNTWTEPVTLHKYLTGEDRGGFQRSLRGLYQLTESEEEGRIGPLPDGSETTAMQADVRQLFKGPLSQPSAPPVGSIPAP
ncbi:MAG: hypothetical protein CAF45_013030 [Nitrospira sp. CG24E]|nr:MAG: hypothetical protein CAF45_013030 [Nitrospira sp. CG24E]